MHRYMKSASAESQIRPTYTSKYKDVYDSGFRFLRFPRDIEREYGRAVAPVMRRRLTISSIIALAAIVLWCILDVATNRYVLIPEVWAPLGGCAVLLLGALVVLNQPSRTGKRINGWLVFLFDVLLGLGLVVLHFVMESRHMPGESNAYIALLMILAVSFYSGAITLRTTAAALTVVLAYGLSETLVPGYMISDLSPKLGFLVLIVIFGASSSWRLEYADREHYLLNRILGDMAEHDSLTGLFNHAAFMSHGTRAWRHALREKKPIGLLVADIDHFKKFNDRYGHPDGDVCIYRIAAVLSRSAERGLDAVARIGGEEFAIFWYDIPPDQVARKAEDIQSMIRQLEIPHAESNTSSQVTLSIGLCSLVPGEVEDLKSAIRQADKALYEAKRGGRNRICSA